MTRERLTEETGFELLWPPDVPVTPVPTGDELATIRRIDPDGAFLCGRIF
ncbi:hypothetical protein [Plantactinospora sp. KBS50]|nr:hypothetical protein [Plantactinospora sp. KBS50]